MNVRSTHVQQALERADAMAQEDIIHLFLDANGVDAFRFVEETSPRFVRLLCSLDEAHLAQTFAAEFLRGMVVGILAARLAAEEEEG